MNSNSGVVAIAHKIKKQTKPE